MAHLVFVHISFSATQNFHLLVSKSGKRGLCAQEKNLVNKLALLYNYTVIYQFPYSLQFNLFKNKKDYINPKYCNKLKRWGGAGGKLTGDIKGLLKKNSGSNCNTMRVGVTVKRTMCF